MRSVVAERFLDAFLSAALALVAFLCAGWVEGAFDYRSDYFLTIALAVAYFGIFQSVGAVRENEEER